MIAAMNWYFSGTGDKYESLVSVTEGKNLASTSLASTVTLCGKETLWQLNKSAGAALGTLNATASLTSCNHSTQKYTQTVCDLQFTPKSGLCKTQNPSP